MRAKLMIFLMGILFLGLTFSVKANSINSIKMDIYLDSNGNAHVKEVWDAYLNQGTEGYRSYTNLDGASISSFKVSDETRSYEEKTYWNTGASFNDKAYKYGINRISNGVELCFGISKYGYHKYTLDYVINNFVFETADAQLIYWQFINEELASMTDSFYIKIYADKKFSNNLDVWGYGNYGGYAYVYDGYIEISNDNLSRGDYVVGLVKFAPNTFNVSNKKGNNFDYYYNLAEEGSTKYVDDTDNYKESFASIIWRFIGFIFSFVPFILIFIFGIIKFNGHQSGTYKLDYGAEGKKLPKNVNMFRDIPCNKDIIRAYWVAYNFGLMKKQTDFLGAVLLKWLKQKHIEIRSNTVGRVFKKEETCIVFKEAVPLLDTDLEKDLYGYMYQASKDGILESREFEKWCSSNYSEILGWFNKVLDYENKILEKEGLLTKTTKKVLLFNTTVYTVSPKLREEAIKMQGLKEFFNYFKNMDDKEAIQVMLWEEYLIYAQIFGVAKEVASQFKKLYPDVITDYDYDSVVFVRTIAYSGMNSASSARSRAESYSSGGGGFSSGGGGGGSFGGGGGGFR